MASEKTEAKYYEPIKLSLEELFKKKFGNCHLEISAKGIFSNTLKQRISQFTEIVFYFLQTNRPDIAGFVEEGELKMTYSIVAEVKDETINLDHIYQTRRYAELLNSKYSFLISTKEIPEEVKRLSKTVFKLLAGGYGYEKLTLVQFDPRTSQFVEWFEDNLFEGE